VLYDEDWLVRGRKVRARAMWKPDCKPMTVLLVLRSLCSHTTAVLGLKLVMAAWVRP